MNFLDHEIITFVNQFSQRSWLFDDLVRVLSYNQLLKGGVLTAIIWWAWFRSAEGPSRVRAHIISTLLCCAVAMVLSRGLAAALPFRVRPLQEESLHFLLPHGMYPSVLQGWSSFPSDHAVLFFALSVGLFFVSGRVGVFALSYTILFIMFPRVYLGLHYPTDIIGGALLGGAIVLLGNFYLVHHKKIRSIVSWSDSRPSLFYPLFFLLTYQIADMFDNSRVMIRWGAMLIEGIID